MAENPEDPAFWDEPTKLIFYTVGALNVLQQVGMIEGGKLKVTEQGAEHFKKLFASGYRPKKADVLGLLSVQGTMLSCHRDSVDGAAELVVRLDEVLASQQKP